MSSYFKRVTALVFATILLNLIVSSNAAAQTVTVDSTFTPVLQSFSLSSQSGSASAKVSLVQPDGKILVGGRFRIAGSMTFDEPRSGVARFNPDGTLDPSFDAGDISTFETLALPADGGTIEAIKLQPDGKILIGGYFRRNNETFLRTVERLNPNGSPDPTFQAQIFNAGVYDIEIQPDGKIIVGGYFQFNTTNPANGQTVSIKNLARLNADGSFDFSFASNGLSGSNNIVLLPDGKIVVGNASRTGLETNQLIRYNANGTLDAVLANPNDWIEDLEVQTDGKYVISGVFTHVDGIFQRRIARINQNGGHDASLTTGGFTNGLAVLDVAIQADGKIVIGGDFQIFRDLTRWRVARLNPDGTVDTTFVTSTPIAGNVATVALLPDGKVFIGGTLPLEQGGNFYNNVGRLNANGSIDRNFNGASVMFGGEGLAIREQPDGKVLIGGDWDAANGLLGRGIARYNIDGTLDTTQIRSMDLGSVADIEFQSDGKILTVQGESPGLLYRYNTDGTRDTTFSTPFVAFSASIDKRTEIRAIAVQPDNKILVGGQLITGSSNSPSLSALIRLNPNGTRDTTFPFVFGIGSGIFVHDIALQPDGKIVIGGNFSSLNGQPVQYLARVNADGTIDSTFNASAQSTVLELELQPDGKIVFTSGTQVLRVNPNGAPDAGFAPASFDNNGVLIDLLAALKIQSNGRILVGGNFTSVNGATRYRIARLNANGTLDNGFDLPNGANDIVHDFWIQTDGKILVSGAFTRIANQPRIGAARLAEKRAPFDFDGDGKTDVGIFRPSDGSWWYSRSLDNAFRVFSFGTASDTIVPGDFTGDGKTDIAIFRSSTGEWYIQRSDDNSFFSFPFGANGDVPAPADYDGDGRTDAAVFRPSSATWFILNSNGSGTSIVQFGTSEDKPVPADYDGDGKSDIAIFRPADGSWWYLRSSDNQFRVFRFGLGTDKPVPGDYSGDGKADLAVFRESTGEWFFQRSEDNSYYSVPFGAAGDMPAPGDYDGDGKFDTAIFRPSTANWFINRSTAGILITSFGAPGDRPIPNTFVP